MVVLLLVLCTHEQERIIFNQLDIGLDDAHGNALKLYNSYGHIGNIEEFNMPALYNSVVYVYVVWHVSTHQIDTTWKPYRCLLGTECVNGQYDNIYANANALRL